MDNTRWAQGLPLCPDCALHLMVGARHLGIRDEVAAEKGGEYADVILRIVVDAYHDQGHHLDGPIADRAYITARAEASLDALKQHERT